MTVRRFPSYANGKSSERYYGCSTYVMLSNASENSVPSSSQSCATHETRRFQHEPKTPTPVTNGTLATLPCWTSFCGVSGKKTPSARGSHASAKDYRTMSCMSTCPADQRTCGEKIEGELSTAFFKVANGAWRRHCSVSEEPWQPVCDTRAS